MIFIYLLGCGPSEPEEYTINVGRPAYFDSGQVDVNIDEPSNEPSDDASSCEAPAGSESMSPLELDGRISCGEEVFLNRCAGCHGENGEGTAQGQVLDDHIDAHDDETLLFSIQFGEGNMPPQNLQPQDAADVLAFIRDAFGS